MNNYFDLNQQWQGFGGNGSYLNTNSSIPNTFRQQQPMPTQQSQSVRGRFVENPQSITPQDVPMDGSIGVYPIKDCSAVYLKAWQQDGTIKTIKYIPEESVPELQRKVTSLEDLEERVRKLELSIKKSSKKKEDSDDES